MDAVMAMFRRLWTRIRTINVPLAAAALFAAAILHILATLATPHLIPVSGYDRLAANLPENTMQILPAVTPDTQPLPFFAPDARYAACRFDTQRGPINLSAMLPEPGWMLALFSPAGDNFFSSLASPNARPEVSILLVPSADAERQPTGESIAVTAASTLTIPAHQGIALIRAPDRGEAYNQRAMAALERASCGPRE